MRRKFDNFRNFLGGAAVPERHGDGRHKGNGGHWRRPTIGIFKYLRLSIRWAVLRWSTFPMAAAVCNSDPVIKCSVAQTHTSTAWLKKKTKTVKQRAGTEQVDSFYLEDLMHSGP